jgi:serine/tyrosine/threonine adenylyltransferase
MKKKLTELNFTNSLIKGFDADLGPATISRQVPGYLYSIAEIEKVSNPTSLITSHEACDLLEISEQETKSDLWAQVFSGNSQINGMRPVATRYGGHQFGNWAHQLGDGRATLLGEVTNSKNQKFEIQLKGAGRTPFSRRADGRAVLRSSLREFLCSEAVHHLGIPTTRALTCVLTGDLIERDMFYDGNPEKEPGAITTRIAPSFLRFGHFQILYADAEIELLKKLTDFTISNYFPEIEINDPKKIEKFFIEVSRRTALLMVEWSRVGFVHGVMNTDNMSILGLTIDYGPYGWLDTFDPSWTPNTTDAERRRYRFGQQPAIALWNLSRLAEALSPLVEKTENLETGLEQYKNTFETEYIKMRVTKLGLESLDVAKAEELVIAQDEWMAENEIDPTIFYRLLGAGQNNVSFYKDAFYNMESINTAKIQKWFDRYAQIKTEQKISNEKLKKRIESVNPIFILRNYLVQMALDELALGRSDFMNEIHHASQTPYIENELTLKFFKKRPDWAKSKPGCSALSCSS